MDLNIEGSAKDLRSTRAESGVGKQLDEGALPSHVLPCENVGAGGGDGDLQNEE